MDDAGTGSGDTVPLLGKVNKSAMENRRNALGLGLEPTLSSVSTKSMVEGTSTTVGSDHIVVLQGMMGDVLGLVRTHD